MSYSDSFPTQRPKLNLVFNGGSDQLDSRLSYSRSSSGTYMSSEKALSSENLLLQSQDFDTTWTATHMSAPTGSQTSPAGDSTAWLLSAASGTGAATLYQNASPKVSSNTSYTLVCHVKAGTASHAYVSFRGAPAESAYAMIDFASPLSPTSGGAVMTGTSSSSVALGNSWYRLTLTFTTATISGGYSFIYVGTSDGTLPLSGGYANYDSTGDTMYAWGAQLSSTNSKVYDSPTTTQISREYSPLLKTASADEPRFEFASDGQSDAGSPRGLLIESQATNYMPNSELDSGYSAYRLTTSTGACVGPSGTLAQVFTETTETGDHYIADAFSTSIDYSTTYTASVYAKKVASGTTDSRIKFRLNGMGGKAYAGFNLVTGTVTQQAGTAIDSATISAVGNGWYRISMTWTNEAADRASGIIVAFNNNTSSALASYVGDGYTSYALAGLQVEEGSAPSSLVSTSGASASRAADSCSVALDGILASGQDVTLYAEGDWGDYTVKPYNRFLAALSQNNDQSWIALYNANSSGASYVKYLNNLEAVQTGVTASGNQKAAMSVAMNSIKHAAAGVASAEDTSATVPSYTQLNIGNNRDAGTLSLNGHCTRVALYGQALSASELAALTS